MSTPDNSTKFNKKIIPHAPGDEMGGVENLTEFTEETKEIIRKLDKQNLSVIFYLTVVVEPVSINYIS